MSNYRSEDEVRSYDLFKGIITGLLVVAIFVSYAISNSGGSDATAQQDGAAPDTETPAASAGEGVAVAPEEAALAAPDLLSPAPGTELAPGTVTFSGMGTPGSTTAVLADGQELGRTAVDENGTWQVDVDIPESVAEIELQAIDEQGNVAASSPPIPMTAAQPEAPETDAGTAESDAGEAGAETGAETNAGEGAGETAENVDSETAVAAVDFPTRTVRAGTVTLTGTGAAGSTLQITVSGATVGSVTVGDDGTWRLSADLPEGSVDIDLETLDEAGNVVESIPAITLPVLPAAAPVVEAPEFAIPGFNPLTGAVAVAGEGAPGARVAALIGSDVVSQAAADPEGRFVLDIPLDPGDYDLVFAQMDSIGNILAKSEALPVAVPDQLPLLALPDFALPDVTAAAPDEAGGDVSGEAAADTGGSASPDVRLPAGPFEWAGTAEPGTQIALVVNGEAAGTATTGEDGTFVIAGDLAAGTKSVQVTVVGADGAVTGLSKEVQVSVADTPVPTVDEPAVSEDGSVVTLSGTAEPGLAVEITAGGEVVATTTADDSGGWTVDVEPLAADTLVRAQVLDENGEPLLQSSPQTLPGSAEAAAETPAEEPAAGDEEAAAEDDAGEADAGIKDDAETVAEAIEDNPSFEILIDGLERAGLIGSLAETGGSYTLFAPIDEAFEAIPPGLLLGWNAYPEEYGDLMRYLVVEGKYSPDDLVDGMVLQTLGGTNVGITHIGELIQFGGVPVFDFADVGNNAIYALPQLVLPPLAEGQIPPTIDVSGVPFFTGPTLTVVGAANPQSRILLTVDGEPLGPVATVQPDGTWQVVGEVASNVRRLVAYMIDEKGLLEAISQTVELPVP